MPDKKEKEDSDKKIREMTKDIVNELLKSGEPVRIDISTGGTIAKCGPANYTCNDPGYECSSKFECKSASFSCFGTFKDSADYTFTV